VNVRAFRVDVAGQDPFTRDALEGFEPRLPAQDRSQSYPWTHLRRVW
jgi:hypothetical protein